MKTRGPGLTRIFCLLVILGVTAEINAQAEPFYKGKTIRIMVGSTAGGFYDRWARLFARYMGKYIPGQPEIIAQNMPGAGSVIATNHVFSVAKPDGLTIAMPLNSVYVDQLVGRKEVQFDLRGAAQVWLDRHGEQRLHPIQSFGRNGRGKIQQRPGLSGRQRDRFSCGKGRGGLPRP